LGGLVQSGGPQPQGGAFVVLCDKVPGTC